MGGVGLDGLSLKLRREWIRFSFPPSPCGSRLLPSEACFAWLQRASRSPGARLEGVLRGTTPCHRVLEVAAACASRSRTARWSRRRSGRSRGPGLQRLWRQERGCSRLHSRARQRLRNQSCLSTEANCSTSNVKWRTNVGRRLLQCMQVLPDDITVALRDGCCGR